jgi:hypothetical protein
MPQPQIVRSEVVVIDTVGENDYGDLLFTDKTGTDHKIGEKRKRYFDVIKPGAAVQLNYATAYGKEYIYNAVPVGDNLPPPVTPAKPPVVESEKPKAQPAPQRHSGEEIGMWWKELGEMLRSGDIEPGAYRDFLRKYYYAQMMNVLGLKFEKEG